jgi:uncharacterized membrane protein YeaQ/YmgE (transglycosylase-associated protein family)
MTLNTALVILIVGALAGLISGLLAKTKGKGFNLVVHLIVGIVGAFHGRWFFGLLDVHASGMIGHIMFAGVGAVIFLYPLRFIKPA